MGVRSGVAGFGLVCLWVAPAAADVIPADRMIDWRSTGVPGGVPNFTRICATLDVAAYGNGSSDATAAIQAAVDGCNTSAPNTSPGPGVVSIPAGKYKLSGTVDVKTKSYLVIRGAGADQTIIDAGGQAFSFGVNGVVAANIAITAGAA